VKGRESPQVRTLTLVLLPQVATQAFNLPKKPWPILLELVLEDLPGLVLPVLYIDWTRSYDFVTMLTLSGSAALTLYDTTELIKLLYQENKAVLTAPPPPTAASAPVTPDTSSSATVWNVNPLLAQATPAGPSEYEVKLTGLEKSLALLDRRLKGRLDDLETAFAALSTKQEALRASHDSLSRVVYARLQQQPDEQNDATSPNHLDV
jgi:hypothetical protein